MILVDTSIWVDYLRNGNDSDFDLFETFIAHDFATCGVVKSEILPFIKLKGDRAVAENLLSQLHYLSPKSDEDLWEKVLQYQSELIRSGVNNVGVSDLILIYLSLYHQVPLLSSDKHFKLAASVLPIKVMALSDLEFLA